jgi:hypothetical protein
MKKYLIFILCVLAFSCTNNSLQTKEPYQQMIDQYAQKYTDEKEVEGTLSQREVVTSVLEDVYQT